MVKAQADIDLLPREDDVECGYMLLAVVVMVALVLIALSVAAPVVARELQREKELESEHRAEQYVRAIRLYYRHLGAYPPSIEALQQTNNMRYLRRQYIDPLTGKADYKLIHQGEQKTKIHVFFGQELDGLTANLGAATGMQSSGGMGAPAGGLGSGSGSAASTNVTSTNALNAGFGNSSIGTSVSTGASGSGINATTGFCGSSGSSGSTGSPGCGSSDAFGDGTMGAIVGVGTSKSGDSIIQPNGQSTYDAWEFWYDPRIERLYLQANLSGGGGMGSQAASSFGQSATSTQNGTNGASGQAGPQ